MTYVGVGVGNTTEEATIKVWKDIEFCSGGQEVKVIWARRHLLEDGRWSWFIRVRNVNG